MMKIVQLAAYFIILAYTPLGLALEKIPDFLGATVTPECDGESHFPQKKISNDIDLCVTEESYGDFGGLSSQEADWVGEESSMVELKDYIYVSCPPVYDLEINSNPTNECKKDDADLIDCCVLRAIVDPIDPDDIPSHGPISGAGDFAPHIKREKMPEGLRDLHDKFPGKPKPHHTFKGVKKIGDPVIPGFRDKKFPWTKHEDGESSASEDCFHAPDDGWQTVTDVLSEDDFQIGFTDAVTGAGQFSKFDNDSSIVCVEGEVKDVYVGETASDSNLGAFIDSGMDCKLRNDDLSSGGRGVDKIICPSP